MIEDARPFLSLLREHRSIRRYRDDVIPSEHVREAIVAGQAASTSSAVQSYCIVQVHDPQTREALVPLTGGQTKVAQCGAFFVICGDTRRHRLICERAGQPFEARLEAFMLAVIDATLFAQNFVVALESMGYGICYIGGLRNQLDDVDALLELPHGVYPLYGLCAGVPDEAPSARPRFAPEAVLFADRYPDDTTILEHVDAYDEVYRAYLASRDPDRPVDGTWSGAMAPKFSSVQRAELAAYYASKGADLS